MAVVGGNLNRAIVLKAALAVVVMFAFAVFAMPPLYNLLCEITGIGGKIEGRYTGAGAAEIDETRTIKVQLVATNNGAMPWTFAPLTGEVRLHPGQSTKVLFHARNPTGKDMVAQAIPNITPTNAASFLHKTECFCFNQQPLKAGHEATMPVVFFVDPKLPPSVQTITLSYTLFDVTARANQQPVAQLN